MRDDHDEEIAKAFEALKSAEEGRVPPFEATLGAARRRSQQPAPVMAWRRFAAAAALLIAVGGGLWTLQHNGAIGERESPIGPVWAWRSPTESLLDVPGAHLLNTMPTLPTVGSTDPLHLPQLNGGVR